MPAHSAVRRTSFRLVWLVLMGVVLLGYSAPLEPPPPSTRLDDGKVKRATEVKDRHIDTLMALPAVVGAGFATSPQRPGEAAILLYLSRELKPKERRRFPRVLEGVPVETLVSGPFTERRKKDAKPGSDQRQTGSKEKTTPRQ